MQLLPDCHNKTVHCIVLQHSRNSDSKDSAVRKQWWHQRQHWAKAGALKNCESKHSHQKEGTQVHCAQHIVHRHAKAM